MGRGGRYGAYFITREGTESVSLPAIALQAKSDRQYQNRFINDGALTLDDSNTVITAGPEPVVR